MTEFEIKAAVRERDGHRCVECGMTQEAHCHAYGKGLQVHRRIPGSPYAIESCETLCVSCHGPKPRLPRLERIRRLLAAGLPISVKIEEDVYRLAKTAASWKGASVSDYISAIVRPAAQRDCAKIGKQASEKEEGE